MVSIYTQPPLSQRWEAIKMESVEKRWVSKSHTCFCKAPNPGRFFWVQLIVYTKEKHVLLFKSWYLTSHAWIYLLIKAKKNERRKKNVLWFCDSSIKYDIFVRKKVYSLLGWEMTRQIFHMAGLCFCFYFCILDPWPQKHKGSGFCEATKQSFSLWALTALSVKWK